MQRAKLTPLQYLSPFFIASGQLACQEKYFDNECNGKLSTIRNIYELRLTNWHTIIPKEDGNFDTNGYVLKYFILKFLSNFRQLNVSDGRMMINNLAEFSQIFHSRLNTLTIGYNFYFAIKNRQIGKELYKKNRKMINYSCNLTCIKHFIPHSVDGRTSVKNVLDPHKKNKFGNVFGMYTFGSDILDNLDELYLRKNMKQFVIEHNCGYIWFVRLFVF